MRGPILAVFIVNLACEISACESTCKVHVNCEVFEDHLSKISHYMYIVHSTCTCTCTCKLCVHVILIHVTVFKAVGGGPVSPVMARPVFDDKSRHTVYWACTITTLLFIELVGEAIFAIFKCIILFGYNFHAQSGRVHISLLHPPPVAVKYLITTSAIIS